MTMFKLNIILSLSSPPMVDFYSDTKAIAIQRLKSELSLLIFIFATDNAIPVSSDKHAYDHRHTFLIVIHSNLTEMRNVCYQNKIKM